MQKKKIFKIEDSNIENIGSDMDKKLRETAAATEKAWKKIKKDKPGRYVWRIEQFKVKKNIDEENGIFYNDDSYIVLNGYLNKDEKLVWDVHFWLGKTTSQDEAGTAAYKTVEVDDFLGGDPIQHRETSGHESRMFLSYFPQGIRILEGGVESGFNHIKPESWNPRLLWIKGKKNVRVVECDIESKSLNSGDTFVLDTGLILYQYQGRKAGKDEKLKAGRLQRAIDDERKGKPEVVVFSQTDDIEKSEEMRVFAGYFTDIGEEVKAGEPASVEATKAFFAKISTDVGGDDAEWEKASDKSLWQLSDASGSLEFKKVQEGKITKDKLVSDDVFIADVGSEVFVWVGKGASAGEKKKGMSYATQYLADNGRPAHLPITQVFEGGENEVFEESFD